MTSDRDQSAAKIILLNGVSSAGKSSLARALQKRLDAPYLHVCIDSFEEMMPQRREEGADFARETVLARLLSGMHRSLAAMAGCGNNLIVDHVMLEGSNPANWLSECLTCLEPFDVFFVGVHCPLEELQRREKERGDRGSGLAEWQSSRIHRQTIYDFELDTSRLTPEEGAACIMAAMAASPKGGLRKTLQNLGETSL